MVPLVDQLVLDVDDDGRAERPFVMVAGPVGQRKVCARFWSARAALLALDIARKNEMGAVWLNGAAVYERSGSAWVPVQDDGCVV